jgi:hypothetical protein
MCCLKYEQNAYEDAVKRMPKVESFVQTPDGPGNVKSVDLLRETVKVSLDSAPEPLKKFHNCEVCVLRNGKGSRDGIEIPDRPARYVEEKDEELFSTPILATPFTMDEELEEALVREKMGIEGGETGKPRRRHRGGRRRHKSGGAEQAKPQQQSSEKKTGEKKSEKKVEKPAGEKKQGGEKPAGEKPRKPRQGKPAEKKAEKPQQAVQQPPKAEGGEGAEKKRRRPRHRGGRRHHKSGEGSAPKSE